jgi:hypothetical protein
MTKLMPKTVEPAQITTTCRKGITFYYVEGEGVSDACCWAIARTLAMRASQMLMKHEWARVCIVSDQHDGGIGVSIGDGQPLPIYDLFRVLPSWSEDQTARRIREAMRPIPIYRNPQ